MALPYPYRRTWEFIRANKGSLGMVTVANVIFVMLMQLVGMVFSLVINLVMTFLVMFLMIGAFILFLLGPVGIVIGVLMILVISAVFYLVLIGFMVLLMGVQFGWMVYISERIDGISRGEGFDLAGVLSDLGSGWKDLLRKGTVLGALFFAVLVGVITVANVAFLLIPVTLLVITSTGSAGPSVLAILVIVLWSLLVFFGIMLLAPALNYVMDQTTVHIARGRPIGGSLRMSFSDVVRLGRRFRYYYIGMLVISIASLGLFPLAMVIQWVVPIATRTFLIVNDDL